MVTSGIKIIFNAATAARALAARLPLGLRPISQAREPAGTRVSQARDSARQAGRIDAHDLVAGWHPDRPGDVVDLAAGLAA